MRKLRWWGLVALGILVLEAAVFAQSMGLDEARGLLQKVDDASRLATRVAGEVATKFVFREGDAIKSYHAVYKVFRNYGANQWAALIKEGAYKRFLCLRDDASDLMVYKHEIGSNQFEEATLGGQLALSGFTFWEHSRNEYLAYKRDGAIKGETGIIDLGFMAPLSLSSLGKVLLASDDRIGSVDVVKLHVKAFPRSDNRTSDIYLWISKKNPLLLKIDRYEGSVLRSVVLYPRHTPVGKYFVPQLELKKVYKDSSGMVELEVMNSLNGLREDSMDINSRAWILQVME